MVACLRVFEFSGPRASLDQDFVPNRVLKTGVQRGEAPAPVLSLPKGRESEGVPQI